ncbi:spermidine hydroxycinnamoyl transferase-like [Eucalyptus grandis]|uniref:spermidine hydroxycinnamoyl transferase-like n=1 Tax=Eucalyptus grandis TaxID=71139 RepID=UPI00192E86AB|nr:spermidine hydroxycinnamoyl transferase-like [Eucalyptus grandis]
MEAFQTTKNSALIVERSVPLAVLPEQETPGGRLAKTSRGKLVVDCQKKLGVPFVEAISNRDIESLGDTRVLYSDVLGKLIYKDPTEDIPEVAPLLTAQVTKFRCGGFTIGIAIDHCMVDGGSTMDFMNTWAKIARGKPLSLVPSHDRIILKARVPPQINGVYKDLVHPTAGSSSPALRWCHHTALLREPVAPTAPPPNAGSCTTSHRHSAGCPRSPSVDPATRRPCSPHRRSPEPKPTAISPCCFTVPPLAVATRLRLPVPQQVSSRLLLALFVSRPRRLQPSVPPTTAAAAPAPLSAQSHRSAASHDAAAAVSQPSTALDPSLPE